MKSSIIKNLFSFFKLSAAQRGEALKPIDLRTWIIHGISEFIGTIFISMGLAGLSIYVGHHTVEHWGLLSDGLVGFFAGFVVVGLCLFIFLRWSCDLNPIVTITRYLKGLHNGWYASYKIFIQVLGSFAAGGIILLIGHFTSSNDLPNAPINALASAKKTFLTEVSTIEPSMGLGVVVIFFTEVFISAILLFSIFSPTIHSKYRDFMILFIISMSVWLGIFGGSAAINPARGLAQQLPTLFLAAAQNENALKIINEVSVATITMILGDLFSTVFYVFMQGFNEHYFNPMLHKIILYKNNHAKSMISSNDFKKLYNKDEDQKDK